MANVPIPPRQIHLVPPQLRHRRNGSRNDLYTPLMVSLGPYHHWKKHLKHTEKLKLVCLGWFTWGDNNREQDLYNRILNRIDEFRSCYAEASLVGRFNNEKLARMMLLDACFIINVIHNSLNTDRNNIREWCGHHGMAAATLFPVRDIMVLENQIPFQVVKLLMDLDTQPQRERSCQLMNRFLSWITLIDGNQGCYQTEREDPLHILEACWRVAGGRSSDSQSNNQRGSYTAQRIQKIERTFQSVMDLKAKGIHLKARPTYSLNNIDFIPGVFSAQLQLPVRYISELTQICLSNMIAFEISSSPSLRQPIVLSYTIFMKSLIESPADVKELQRKRILFNKFADHKLVVHLFKEIDTFGVMDTDVFIDVQQRIEEHCNNKAKTWLADLIHTKFRTPWTVIALLAAIYLPFLASVQTWLTYRPNK